MIIKTKDFVLRPVKMSDAKAYFEMHNDPEARWNFTSYPKNLAEAKKEVKGFVNYQGHEYDNLAIEVEGNVAGFFWLAEIVPKHKTIIGFGLIKSYRGKGLGTKVLKMVTDYAFKRYKLVRVGTFTRTYNKGARKMLEKAGYKFEGIMRKNNMQNGKYRDDCVYARIK